MWSEKQRKYQKNICSKLMLAILLLASVITLTACRSSNIKETTKQTDHKTKKWKPLVIIVTDRTVLDRQLQDTITSFDATTGLVETIGDNKARKNSSTKRS